jgi:hypothetical protein
MRVSAFSGFGQAVARGGCRRDERRRTHPSTSDARLDTSPTGTSAPGRDVELSNGLSDTSILETRTPTSNLTWMWMVPSSAGR